MYLVVLFVITVLSAILALSLLVFKDEKQIVISVLCENMLLENVFDSKTWNLFTGNVC